MNCKHCSSIIPNINVHGHLVNIGKHIIMKTCSIKAYTYYAISRTHLNGLKYVPFFLNKIKNYCKKYLLPFYREITIVLNYEESKHLHCWITFKHKKTFNILNNVQNGITIQGYPYEIQTTKPYATDKWTFVDPDTFDSHKNLKQFFKNMNIQPINEMYFFINLVHNKYDTCMLSFGKQ